MEKHDEQYLWANITIVEEEVKKGNITNVTGYLLKAFTDDYRPLETEHDKQKQEDEDKAKMLKKQQKQDEQKEKELKQAYDQWKKEQVEATL